MENPDGNRGAGERGNLPPVIVPLIAAAIFLASIFSPPGLMDDVDAVQAQIARNMLESGDWVTARLNGVAYLEKPPLIYWMMALSYALFGVHDWAARLPLALSVVLLCVVTMRFGRWAFGEPAGVYSGLVLATSAGLWLFTRVQIPDAILTLTITLAMWALLRALEEGGWRWGLIFWACLGAGLLLKGLIAALFPLATALLYLGVTRQLCRRQTWRSLHPFAGALVALAIASPWHALAILRNPPYFDFTLSSTRGQYRGFFWFYFLNEHVFRFLNIRHPRDYNTVPRLWFWLLHLVWLFPWSVFSFSAAKLGFTPADRAASVRLLALCWAGFVLIFFTFSTTQEYYSMPCYPALALLLGNALAVGGKGIERGWSVLVAVAAVAVSVIAFILLRVWHLPAPGDISQALARNPDAYTLSLGHMGDLTIRSFAYLRLPLVVAGIALLGGAVCIMWAKSVRTAVIGAALMMTLFLHAARLALIRFDPYLGSRELAEALVQAPPGELIADNQYYTFSSVFFYANRPALLLNGRVNNLEYGSYAPNAPNVFLDDAAFVRLWKDVRRRYLLVEAPALARIEGLVGRSWLHLVRASGGKFLFSNLPLSDR